MAKFGCGVERMGSWSAAPLSAWGAVLIFFHASEFLLALFIHGKGNVSWTSFLISKQYIVAMACALVEYGVECWFVPGLKRVAWVSSIGLVVVVLGELIRKLAVITAHQNFTHDIKTVHCHETHQLVTHGIYRFVRHPGYMGFFFWSIGTQILLCNPICIVGYTIVMWMFFNDRIQFEEFYLRSFFGDQYTNYASTTYSGISFVR